MDLDLRKVKSGLGGIGTLGKTLFYGKSFKSKPIATLKMIGGMPKDIQALAGAALIAGGGAWVYDQWRNREKEQTIFSSVPVGVAEPKKPEPIPQPKPKRRRRRRVKKVPKKK
jgi:hypothetical protein